MNVGLVLSGGGIKGVAHIGVIEEGELIRPFLSSVAFPGIFSNDMPKKY